MSPEGSNNQYEASIPFMITKDMHQQLADLGYIKDVRKTLEPAEAVNIIAEQRYFKKAESEESKKENPLTIDWNILYAQWEEAYDAMMDTAYDDEYTKQIEKLTSQERASKPVFEYLEKNKEHLSPEQQRFLMMSAIVKEAKEKINAN